jgi:starch-binding outer membrane protein, SusD/RagB family
MIMTAKYLFPVAILLTLLGASCTKGALDKKPDATIAIPSTIDDFQQLLDGLDGGGYSNIPCLFSYRSLGDYLADELNAGDNIYTTYFESYPFITDLLTWNKDMFNTFTTGTPVNEWNTQYQTVLTTNLSLEGLAAIPVTPGNQAAWNTADGTALFVRALMFYNVAQFWAKPYNATTAATDPGIVLRLHSAINDVSVRSTVQQTYNQIIGDLQQAVRLLPNTSSQNTQLSKVRPSQAAAYGLLARTYMTIGDSINMTLYADSALQLYSTLMDYNTLTGFVNFNPETVYSTVDLSGTLGSFYGPWRIDSGLVSLYDSNDLRKTLFYTNTSYVDGWAFIGDYSQNYIFTGLAVDELYLMRAEGNARQGNMNVAMNDLNTLLVARYKTGTFMQRTAVNATDALTQIVTERRKELVHRGCRWTDLRRLNMDPRFATTLTRTLLGVSYTLPPNDSRYTLQIPSYIITASNGSITQNP